LIKLQRQLNSLTANINQLFGKYQLYQQQLQQIDETITHLEEEAILYSSISELFQTLTESRRKEMITLIEELSTKALRAVFQRDDYNLKLVFTHERSTLACRAYLQTQFENQIIDVPVVEGHGGGTWDIISFVLRVVAILFSHQQKILILDEPFKHAHLSHLQMQALGSFIHELCHSLQFQIIMVSANNFLTEHSDTTHRFFLNQSHSTEIEKIK
jgi:ABC-type branched-subunit amino acid transport system ATPase component